MRFFILLLLAFVLAPAAMAHVAREGGVPVVPLDAQLTPITAAISGVTTAEAHCGGASWGSWGTVYLGDDGLALPGAYLDPLICNRLHRFQLGWRPNAACFRRIIHCDTGYVALFALVLTHESIHVSGDLDEASTECKAIQRVRDTFPLLGEASKLYGDALVRYALWWHNKQTKYVDWWTGRRIYYSPNCKRDGAWDMTAGDGLWP